VFELELVFMFAVLVVSYTYFAYPLILMVLHRFRERETFVARKGPRRKVSLVIAAYNEEKVIDAKIRNSLAIKYPKELLEIIVASDGSTDGTNEIVARYKDQGVTLLDYQDRSGKINVLNRTIPQASGEIIVLSDANTMYEAAAIEELCLRFSDPRVGGVCGELHLVNPNNNTGGNGEGAYWKYEKYLKRLEGEIYSVLGANGGIYAIRKELYVQIPSGVIIDDFVIPMKIAEKGYRIVYQPSAYAEEETSQSMGDEFKRKVRIGAGNYQSISLLRRLLLPKYGFLSFAFWSHKIVRWCVPFLLILCFFSNLFLVSKPWYLWIFCMQCIFYLCAVIGFTNEAIARNLKLLSIPYYFATMNLALFLGFIRYVRGKQKVTWDKAQR
jgi:biofilm PGA synthesis N-glycosyltransferase PgaC